ncbi:hypothetical protein [Microbacterium sp.]|uniref:hypothetical protein n=1 Tax=Microbacterium sp. TaxID=51671 RepID=UPI003C78DEC9
MITVSDQRGQVFPVGDPSDDDVIDPYRRSWSTYLRAADELMPGVDQVTRVVRVAAAS